MAFTIDEELLGLADSVALVVGGSGEGMGHQHCVQLARAGCHVVIGDVKRNDEVIEEIKGWGRKALYVELDALSAADHKRAVDAALAEFGRFDVSVNHVGGHFGVSSILDYDESDWDRTVDLCLKSCFHGVRAQARAMIENGTRVRIITVSSTTGADRPSDAGIAAYGAAKAGVKNFTQSAAVELARYGIRVNCIIPGTQRLAFLAEQPETTPEVWVQHAAQGPVMRRFGDPWETASLSVFLASNLSSYVTGQAIASDGGLNLTVHREQRDPLPTTLPDSVEPLFDAAGWTSSE
jgi:NAD(P)-dependent dehydrogenase (short-subunit alcohol dehydrogenase family)